MKKTVLFACLLSGLSVSAARAGDDRRCGNVPFERWMSEAQISEKAAGLGLDVRQVEIDDGCYEVEGRDRTGRRIELRLHPETGAQVSVDGD